MRQIPSTWMRGGTSKCWVFRRDDLKVPGLTVDEVLLRVYGSPDSRQVDGVGGATSTTSKAVILAPSTVDGIDVDYTFAQVGIEEAKVDWGSNCGNCSAVVAPFAVLAGWVNTSDPSTEVRVFNTNTGQVIVQQVQTPGGELDEALTAHIPGVPFPGAPVRMGFEEPEGKTTGTLFPTGSVIDTVGDGDGQIEATLIDAGAPVVMVKGADLGYATLPTAAQLDADATMLARLDVIRRNGAVAMGLVDSPEQAARAIPKLAMVASPTDEGAAVDAHMLSMGRPHPALPVTGSVGLTIAASAPGTVIEQVTDAERRSAHPADELRIKSPAGVITTFVSRSDGRSVVGVTRTFRRLAEGAVFLPPNPTEVNGDAS